MSSTANLSAEPIAMQSGEGEALWFLGALVTIKASTESTAGRVAVIEHLAPRDAGSPLHVHHREDEWFYVTEGELMFSVGGDRIVAPAGSFVYGPRDVPHSFTVTSEQARFLLVVEPAGLEDFVRAPSEPARELVIAPASTEPPDVARISQVPAQYGIEHELIAPLVIGQTCQSGSVRTRNASCTPGPVQARASRAFAPSVADPGKGHPPFPAF